MFEKKGFAQLRLICF